MSVYATDEKIYLVEYDEDIVGAYWQEDEGDVVQDHDYPGENALYCMDFQGDMKKVGWIILEKVCWNKKGCNKCSLPILLDSSNFYKITENKKITSKLFCYSSWQTPQIRLT